MTISVPDVETGTEAEQPGAGQGGGVSTEPGGSPDKPAGSGGTAAPKDTAENDTPPPAGSPEAAFERYCEQYPDACG